MALRYTIGVVVEGVGNDTSKTGGLAFSWGDAPTSGDYEWLTSLTKAPGSINDAVNLFTGKHSSSSYTFEIANTDTVATRLLYADPRPDYALSSSLTDSATSVTVEDFEGTAVTTLADTVVYVRDEAILLGTHSGSGTYTGCTRGVYSTTASAQEADTFIYAGNPYQRHRQVLLVFHDRADGTESIRWRGYVDDIETNSNGTVVRLRCVGLFAAIQKATLNRDARRIRFQGFTYKVSGVGPTNLYGSASFVPKMHKTGSAVGTIPVQTGDTFTLGTHSGTDSFTIDEAALEDIGAPSFPFDEDEAQEVGGIERAAYKEDVYEVWYTDARFSSASKRGGPSSIDLEKPLHPIHLAMGFMTSTGASSPSTSSTTFDAFGASMGAGLPLDWFDTASIKALVDDEPDLEIDRLGPLGWGGSEVNLFDLTNDVLLRPYGYVWAVQQDGLISITRLEGVTISEFCQAKQAALRPIVDDRGNRLQWRVARESQFNTVKADVGKLPWREPDTITINSRDGQRDDTQRGALFSSTSELSFDLRTFAQQADDTDILARVLNFAVLGYYALPQIGVLVVDSSISGVTYDLGATVVLNAPQILQAWFIDRDGNRVNIDADNEAFAGKIVSRVHIFDEQASVYKLDLLLTQWASGVVARTRAPALEIVSASGTTITVEQNAFHADVDDTSFFEDGTVIEVWSPDGTRVSGTTTTINSSTSTTIVTADDISGSVSAGEIVRLADIDDYNVESSSLACALREYAFMSDADEAIGTANEIADVYG